MKFGYDNSTLEKLIMESDFVRELKEKGINTKFINGSIIVCDNGEFYRVSRPEIAKVSLKPSTIDGRPGYCRLMIDGKLKLAHRVVAESFIPNPDNLPVVNHKDGIRYNNKVENLEWCSQKQNAIHYLNTISPKYYTVLKFLREKRGFTKPKLLYAICEETGVQIRGSRYRDIENGLEKPKEIEKMALEDFFGKPMAYLLSNADKRKIQNEEHHAQSTG